MEEANKSEYIFHMGAVIFKGKRIISSGHNYIRSCSTIRPIYKKWSNSVHSELACILNAGDWRKLKGCDMLVMKISKKYGLLSNAKPCKYCLNTCLLVGIRRIYYTNEEGCIVSMDLNKLD